MAHVTVGTELTQAEYELITAHQFNSQATGDIPYASSATQLSRLADVAVGQVLTSGGVGVAPAWSATPVLTGGVTLNDNAVLGFGTSNGESTIKSDGTNTIWTIVAGSLLFEKDYPIPRIHATGAAATSYGLQFYTENSNAAARNWGFALDVLTHGDFAIVQSTTKGGAPGANDRLYISGAGNVGIGLTSFTNVTGEVLLVAGGLAFTNVLNAWIDDATHGDGTVVHYIGNNTINTTAPSDVRLKENIGPLDGLAVLRQLPVIEFESEHWGPGRWGGFDAQAAGRVLPGLAMQDAEGYWRFQGHLLMPYVVGGIQEIVKRVETLEQENQELRTLIARGL